MGSKRGKRAARHTDESGENGMRLCDSGGHFVTNITQPSNWTGDWTGDHEQVAGHDGLDSYARVMEMHSSAFGVVREAVPINCEKWGREFDVAYLILAQPFPVRI
jgi:hypothetical protein